MEADQKAGRAVQRRIRLLRPTPQQVNPSDEQHRLCAGKRTDHHPETKGTEARVTAKMKKFFWAKYYESGGGKKQDKR